MKTLCLFDIDNTLTPPMQSIEESMKGALTLLKGTGSVMIGVVGGSDRKKALAQLGEDVLNNLLDVAFHENGTVFYKADRLMYRMTLEEKLSDEEIDQIVRYLFELLSSVPNDIKLTGTFIERRSCMLNFSPIGRNASQSQRVQFQEWDRIHHLREQWVEKIKSKFQHLPIEVAIGGMISIDIFPIGCDKTLALEPFYTEKFDTIHFFGDSVEKGGNDHTLYHDPRVVGHRVSDYRDCERQIRTLARLVPRQSLICDLGVRC